MAKRAKHYRITEPVSGSFVGTLGRISYELDAGTVSESDVDAEVLALLLATGKAVPVSKPAESEDSA